MKFRLENQLNMYTQRDLDEWSICRAETKDQDVPNVGYCHDQGCRHCRLKRYTPLFHTSDYDISAYNSNDLESTKHLNSDIRRRKRIRVQ